MPWKASSVMEDRRRFVGRLLVGGQCPMYAGSSLYRATQRRPLAAAGVYANQLPQQSRGAPNSGSLAPQVFSWRHRLNYKV